MGRVIRLDNDVHFMRKELDTLQRKVKSFDVTTEYALADSDVIAPTTGWGADKPSYQTGKFIWVRNTLHTGYGDIVLEPYNIGDGQEHILSLTMEYAVSNDAFTEPTGSWVANAPTLTEGQYLWTRTKIVTNFGTTTTSAIRMTGEKGITGDAISIKGDTGDEGKGYDFIYYTSEYDTAPTTPSKNVVRNEGVYEAWCDYPCSVTDKYKYTYMSMRTSDNGEWGNWSTPTLMSSIGEKGEDGEGYEIIFRQTTTNTPPTFNNGENLHTFTGKVNGKSFNDNDFVPTDWSDDSNGVNSTYKYEYASTRTKTNGLWSDFSSPSLWNIYSESTYTHIRYSSVNNPSSISQTTTTPTSNTAYIGIYVDKKESETFSSYSWKKWIPMEGIDYDGRFLHIRYSNDEGTTFTDGDVGGSYMGICYSYTSTAPDNPEAYTWSRIRGSDGAGMEFAYYSSATEQTSLSAPTTVRTGTPQANNWYERPYGVTEQVQYCYVSTKPSGGSSWGTPVLWAKYGATGQRGGVGERGEDGIGLEQIFCRTDKDGYIVDNTGTRLTINGAVRKLASYTTAQPHTWSAVTTDDYFDETKGWYDDPVGVTENCPYEYVAQRMKTVTNKTKPDQANYKVAVWGKFNVYSQWSNYSEDGVSITGTTVYYAQTEDYTNAPTSPSAWKEGTPQTYEAGKFYWVKQIIHYDNGSSDETAPICVSGVDGQGIHFVYYCGNVIPTTPTDSGSVVPNGSTDSDYDKWVEEPVSPTADDPYLFMSQSTDYNYQTGKWTNFSTPAQIGTYSTDGTTVKTEWRYLTKANTDTPSTSYGGWSTTPVAVTKDKPYCFITSRIVTGNSNGAWATPVLWSRYANDGNRGTGIFTLTSYTESFASMTGNDKVKYKISKSTITNQIGSITLLVGDQLRTGYYIYPVLASDNTYYYLGEKSNIRGESGASIDSVVNYYLASANSSGVTHSTTGWTTDVNNSNAKLSASKPYLWNYEDTFDSDGARVNRTNPVVIGKFGKEISSVTEFYQVSSSDSSVPSSWVNSDSSSFVMPVTDNNNRFLWNYERINYSDGSYDETEKRIIGTYGLQGDKGDTGVSISNVVNHYLATSYTNVQKTDGAWGTWTTSIQSMDTTKQYLWNYETIYGNDGNVISESNPVIIGRYGQNGKSIQFITEYYAVSSSNTNPPTIWESNGSQTFVMPVTDETNRYLWNYELLTFSDGSTNQTEARVIGTHGAKGDGITSIENQYASTTTYSTPSSNWKTDINTVTYNSTYKYLWSRELCKSGDNVISTSSPTLMGVFGEGGSNIRSITEEYRLSTGTSASTQIGEWSTSIPTLTTTNKYLWNRETILFDNPQSSKTTDAKIIGAYGDDGNNGVDGNNITPSIILDKHEDNDLSNTTVGSISSQIASDYVSSELQSETFYTYSYKYDNRPEYNIAFHKQGRIVTVAYNILVRDNVPTTYTKIINVPNWAVPVNLIYLLNIFAHHNNYRARINGNGEFEIASNSVGTGTGGVNIAGSCTYLARDGKNLKSTSLEFVSTTVAQGGELKVRLSASDNASFKGIPIYFRVNDVVYKRYTTGYDGYGEASLNVNLPLGTTSATSGLYQFTAWYDGGSYSGGYFSQLNGEYGTAKVIEAITVQKCTNPTITFGGSGNKCWVRVMNGTYPLRHHDVTIAYNGHSFVGNTDGNGYIYFNLDNYVGSSVSVTATIVNSNRCSAKTVSGNISP